MKRFWKFISSELDDVFFFFIFEYKIGYFVEESIIVISVIIRWK